MIALCFFFLFPFLIRISKLMRSTETTNVTNKTPRLNTAVLPLCGAGLFTLQPQTPQDKFLFTASRRCVMLASYYIQSIATDAPKPGEGGVDADSRVQLALELLEDPKRHCRLVRRLLRPRARRLGDTRQNLVPRTRGRRGRRSLRSAGSGFGSSHRRSSH